MLTVLEIQEHLKKVSYKPGWKFAAYQGRWEGPHMQITTVVPDAYNLGESVVIDVHSQIPPLPDTDALNQWLMWRLNIIETHEMREFFRVDGHIVDDPHREFAGRDL